MTIPVTGATGFIGPSLVALLRLHAHTVICAVRQAQPEAFVHGTMSEQTDWRLALNTCAANTCAPKVCDVVVHLAARVHQINEMASDPLTEYRRLNVAGTLKLAQQAASSGTKRFIFLSTIQVSGEQTRPGQAFCSKDSPNPQDHYALSSLDQDLLQVAQHVQKQGQKPMQKQREGL
ncbi:MAG: NAD-dependent epimerase/dehydratase family protein [Rhodoferax sp.]|nr:NAD-dependent epimerase/dehydratase family protein [Rhodoferax sp.]